MSAALIVKSAGPFTTVQDLGRPWHQAEGIPVSGALDPEALRIANALVGNDGGAAVLEIRLSGPTFEVAATGVRVALCGASSPLQVLAPEPREVPPWQSVTLPRGAVFRVPPLKDSTTACLAVEGGFDLPLVMGSRATCLRAGFGGLEGRILADGDTLPLMRDAPSGRTDMRAPTPPDLSPPECIRVVPGPQDDHFTPAALAALTGTPFTLTGDADRMGLRLKGCALEHAAGFDIVSDGIATGAIQVPGDGQPIILLADHQTTGGYPKIAAVISAHLPALGRMAPGATLRFQAITVQEAQALRAAREREIAAIISNLQPVRIDAAGLSSDALLAVNLIGGVTSGRDAPGT